MKHILFLMGILLVLMGCEENDTPPMIQHPTQAFLVFPYENSECNEGFDITATQSTVLFEWRPGQNTDQYQLKLVNLFTNSEETHLTPDTKIPIILDKATPYSWQVISTSNVSDSIAISDTWRFYNAGEGVVSYAPFPAELLSPAMAQVVTGNSVTLNWQGGDVDEDIEGYDVYLGTANPPDLYAADVTDSEIAGVVVESGQIYYWSITTKDAFGNSSGSGVFQFKVQ